MKKRDFLKIIEPETGTVATAAHSIFNQFDLLGKGLLLATGRCSNCGVKISVDRKSFSTAKRLEKVLVQQRD